ncbi:MAG TPA: hypothetical protein VHZ78_03005 [Rhizomicrobium sp.]|jgi:hypothetical protein|nr:hypothetical protein [Rhizomicrobium sp.]
MNPQEAFKINLNQNLWGLLTSLIGVGVGEQFKLCVLFWLCLVLAVMMIVSVAVTTLAYTINYWRNKMER